MKNRLFRWLSTFTVAGFLITIAYLGWFGLDIKSAVAGASNLSEIQVAQLSPIFTELLTRIGLAAGFGMLAIIFLMASERFKNTQEQIIVENFTGATTQSQDDQITEHQDTNTGVGASLQALQRELAAQDGPMDLESIQKTLSQVCNQVNAAQGLIYLAKEADNERIIELYASYAFTTPDSETISFEFGEGIAGQVAKERKTIRVDQVPKGYITVRSGLGESSPNSIAVFPMIAQNKDMVGVAEIATFHTLPSELIQVLESVFNEVGEKLAGVTA